MAEPHEAAHSLQPPRARHASGAGSGGPASADRSRYSMSSAGGSSIASATTHVEPTGLDSDISPSFLEQATTSSSHTHANARLSTPSPTPHLRREPEPPRAARAGHRNSHRHNRSSGAFLLNDALSSGRAGHDTSHGKSTTHARSSGHRDRDRDRDRERTGGSSRAGSAQLAVPATPESRGRVSSAESNPDTGRTRNASASSEVAAVSPASAGAAASTAAALPSPPSSSGSESPAVSNQTLDIDSAQIVNMALNLSESRRLASRRTVSQQLPPRLAPLPDSAVGGSLLRQLQQQRRISRTMSPRPDRAPGSRAVSGQTATSTSPRVSYSGGLQPAFNPLGDGASGTYRYHFSQSTLARAQKAKDYLELLAQQRRLLELIPPLTPESTTQIRSTSLTSPPTTASNSSHPFLGTGSGSGDLVTNSARLGRPYNPLQYIRNRKVRVRERKTIDGQAQGFGDVSKAAEWVDEVARWAATGQSRVPGGPSVPGFSSADALTAALQSSPPPGSRSAGQGVLAKPKRPRLDWVIDPADMLADVYWLEQGDNKMLVEDHHWRRVFPQDPNLYRPLSQRVDEGAASDQTGDVSGPSSANYADPSTGQLLQTPELGASGLDQGSSARKRARQKLSELRSFHHRHNSSFQSQDILRLRRGSFSDTSDSDSDRRLLSRLARDGSSAGSGADMPNIALLRKAAQDSRDSTGSPALSGDQKNQSVYLSVGSSPANGNGQSSQSTPARGAEVSKNTASLAPGDIDTPSRSGLDLPATRRRQSLDYDSSRPASPELRPVPNENVGLVPVLGGDLSPPPSRAASPPPSRFSKVKHMFRDHSHERGRERTNSSGYDRGSQERDDLLNAPSAHTQSLTPPQQEAAELHSAPITATPSVAGDMSKMASSHDGKGLYRSHTGTFDSHKSHSSVTSMSSLRHSSHGHSYGSLGQHRAEESAGSSSATATLRGIFKNGPRIDTMLRSGVSKVSDMFWRRDGSDPLYEEAGAEPGSSSSDDDSDEGLTLRGRSKKTARHSRSLSTNADWSEKPAPYMSKPGEKHYLDVMPTFGGQDQRGNASHLAPLPDPVSRPPSRRSTRFERLKPPRIDVEDVSTPSNLSEFRPQIPSREHGGGATALLPAGHRRDSDFAAESDASQSRRVSNVSGVEEASASAQEGQLMPTAEGGAARADHPRWSVSQPSYRYQGGALSRREVARLRASMYSSAVLARELSRRANEPRVLGGDGATRRAICVVRKKVVASRDGESLTWPDIAVYSTNAAELVGRPIRHVELYPLAAQVLGSAIQRSGQSWQTSAELFANATVPGLRARLDRLRTRVSGELSGLARQAADEADEVSQDLVAVQRLQVIRVEDTIEQMLRRRRRRFRWVRRAGWLTVEWMLVGFMWFAWLVVMIARVFMGTYSGIIAGVRWLLWL